MTEPAGLASLIAEFARSAPSELVLDAAADLKTWQSETWERSRAKLLARIHSPQAKADLGKLLRQWKQEHPQLPALALALTIESALAALRQSQQKSIELAWTGPITAAVPLRRTDQALLQLIEGAQERLLIVSFAVYKADDILRALATAIQRGVRVTICLEDAEESKGKVSFSGSTAFDKAVFRLACFYEWPQDQRPTTGDGKSGALHAKLAVADRDTVFISSANLTGYAMELNMEMGVLVRDAAIASQVDRLFEELIVQGTLRKVSLDS